MLPALRRVTTRVRIYFRKNYSSISIPPQRSIDLGALIHHATDSTKTGSPPRMVDSPLNGKHIFIKDNIATTDTPTTAGSLHLQTYTSPFPATVIDLLHRQGAHTTTKTNLDEFGMGSHSQSSAFRPVHSPFVSRKHQALSPGGSSGGSAVAVAVGDAWAALGTDTGGSVRLPAAWNGIVGFKPSYGRVSRWGVIAYAHSLDTVGVLARNVRVVEEVFRVLNVHDEKDPTSMSPRLRERIDRLVASRRRESRSDDGLRIGVPLDYHTDTLDPVVLATYKRLLSALQSHGHTLHPIRLPTTRLALPTYYILAPAEASSNLAKYDGVRFGVNTNPSSRPSKNHRQPLYTAPRAATLGPEPHRRILLGTYSLTSEAQKNHFIQTQKLRRKIQSDFDNAFAFPNPLHNNNNNTSTQPENNEETPKVDILITPTTTRQAPTLHEAQRLQGSVRAFADDVLTVPASLAGLPAVNVPVRVRRGDEQEGVMGGEGWDGGGSDGGLCDDGHQSVGIQVIGQMGDDEGVLRAAGVVEEQAGLMV